MKIFNIENGKKKVYVQLEDIQVLLKTDQYIPISIFDKVCEVEESVEELDFIEFYEENEINFFKAIDWIVDVKELNKKNINELINLYEKAEKNKNNYINNHSKDNLTDDEKYEYELLKHKSNSIKNFIMAKYGNLNIPFPEAPNSDKIIIDDSENSGMIISESLNPNSIVMTKKTGEEFRKDDPVNNKLIYKALEIIKSNKNEDNLFKYMSSYDISNDLKTFIIRYRKGINRIMQSTQNKKNKIKMFIRKALKKSDN